VKFRDPVKDKNKHIKDSLNAEFQFIHFRPSGKTLASTSVYNI